MARQLSAWNKFVKSVFQSEKKKNPKCTFGEALKKASQLKKAGKMKGGLGTNDGDSGEMSNSGVTDSGDGMSSSSSSVSGLSAPPNTPVTSSSSLMMGGKTRKRKSGKSKKSRKSRKTRKSRKSKK